MLKYFMNLFALLFILGLILLGISFVSNLSMWYGISIVKGSFYSLLIGLFLHLIQFEFQSNNKKA